MDKQEHIPEEQVASVTVKEEPGINRAFAALGYLSILCLVPLFLKRDSEFAQFHGRQGLAIFILELACALLAWIPIVGWVLAVILKIVFPLVSLGGVISAATGKRWRIPLIGDMAGALTI
ncbi:MAG: DUF4870 domain-containing protein [Candidatus Omnitrophica bacterium]|nr:DUF4870 domain-containing protein [Candidatus Omnitrophota bacterium]